MAEHNDFGRIGEEEACRYLAEQGYSLLARNWHVGHLELDIVADYFGELVFVEVKARRDETFMPAIEAVDKEKRENIVLAAKAYLTANEVDDTYRFDIITVVGEQRPYKIEHIVNAFRADDVLIARRTSAKRFSHL